MRRLIFRQGHFIMAIAADRIRDLPRLNFRKILCIARSDSVNAADLQRLREILLDGMQEAKRNYDLAREDYARNWKYVNEKSRTKAALAVMRENKKLHNTVKRTKAELTKAEALWKIYTEKEINQYGSSDYQ